MGGEKADMVFTSPPYNSGDGGYKTDYKGKTKNFYNSKCDNRTQSEWVKFCDDVINNLPIRTDESPVLWNVMYNARCRQGFGLSMFSENHPYSVKETICWDKKAGFASASKGILSRNWEIIFVLSKGDKYFSTQGKNEVRFNRWDIPAGDQHEEHKATFPVGLAVKAIKDFTISHHYLYEPFLGSGSTLIACEKTNRQCYGMELDPHYCSVIIERWQQFTGKKATLFTGQEQGNG
jgi:site-specific DNA-methyltransferase (adenine-specific)